MQWTDPVVIGRQIRLLDDSRFVELMNALVSETAAKHGIDRSCIATNLNIKEPDGGIDARCVNAPKTAGRLIPALNVDYQFKGGANKKSLSKIVDEDIKAKPRVLEGLKEGHVFVFVAAWDRGDEMEDDLNKKLREAWIFVQEGQVIFITGDTIARLLQDFPGLVARFLGWEMPLVGIEEWSNFRSLRLAARQLGSWTREKLTTVLSALTPAMAESMARRIRRMHSILENRVSFRSIKRFAQCWEDCHTPESMSFRVQGRRDVWST